MLPIWANARTLPLSKPAIAVLKDMKGLHPKYVFPRRDNGGPIIEVRDDELPYVFHNTRNVFSEAAYNGIGFGLGFAVTMRPAETLIAGSPGEYNWGGAATTSFWIDPAEELIAIFMTQVLPSSAYPIRRELRSMVYAAITESNL